MHAETPAFTPSGFEPTAEQRAIMLSQRRVTLVHANAGAAKTTTLALRIGEALSRGLAPEKILALVFTSQARDVLHTRLADIGIAAGVARGVQVHTMETFAAKVLATLEDGEAPAALTNAGFKQYALLAMEQVAAHYTGHIEFLDLRTHNLALSELQAAQTRLKARLALNDTLQDLSVDEAAEVTGLPVSDYLTIMEYERIRLRSFGQVAFRGPHDATYDLATLLARHPDQAQALPRLRLVVGDELHDLNEAAFCVLRALIDPDGVYFVGTGDRDQVIHSHLGADESYLTQRFQARYPGCIHLPLTMTWRHGPHLAYATAAFKEKLVDSSLPLQTTITELDYTDPASCADRVVQALRKCKADRLAQQSCAILLRERHQSIAIENALMRAGIAYRTGGMPGYMQRDEILFLRGMLAVALKNLNSVASASTRSAIVEALAMFAEVPLSPDDLARAKADIAAEPGMLAFFFTGQIQRAGSLQARARISNAVAYLESLDAQTPAHDALSELCHRLDIDAIARRLYLRAHDARIVTLSIAGLLDAARAAATSLRDFAQWLGAADAFAGQPRASNAVLLDCAANAKGQEFDHVILPFLDARSFPLDGVHSREEDNLFYVAITRARAQLTLLSPADATVRSPFLTRMKLLATRPRAQARLLANQQRADMDAACGKLAAGASVHTTPPRSALPGSASRQFATSGSASSHFAPPGSESRQSTSFQSPSPAPHRAAPHATSAQGPAPSRVDLRVPYANKDAAKQLGALWDPVRKTWYVKAGTDPTPFAAWFS